MSHSISLDESVINSFLAGIKGISTLHIPIDAEYQNNLILSSKLRLKLYSTIGKSEMGLWFPGYFKNGNYYFSKTVKNFRVVANDFNDKKIGQRLLGNIESLNDNEWMFDNKVRFEAIFNSFNKFDFRFDSSCDYSCTDLITCELARKVGIDSSMFHKTSDSNNSFFSDLNTDKQDIKFTNVNRMIQASIKVVLRDDYKSKALLPLINWFHKKSAIHIQTHSVSSNHIPPCNLPEIVSAPSDALIMITDFLEAGNMKSSNNTLIVTTWVGGKDYIDNTEWDCFRGKTNVHYVCFKHSGNTEESQIEIFEKLSEKLKNYGVDLRLTNIYSQLNDEVPPEAMPTMTNSKDAHLPQDGQVMRKPINMRNVLLSPRNSLSSGSILDPFIFRGNISLIEAEESIDISSLGMTFACASALAKSAFKPEKTETPPQKIGRRPDEVGAKDRTHGSQGPVLSSEAKSYDGQTDHGEKRDMESDKITPQTQSSEVGVSKVESPPKIANESSTKSDPTQKPHLKWKSNSKSRVVYIAKESDEDVVKEKFDIVKRCFLEEKNELRDSISIISIGDRNLSLADDNDRDEIKQIILSELNCANSGLIIFDDLAALFDNYDAGGSAFQWLREMTDVYTGVLVLNRRKNKNTSKDIHKYSDHIISISANDKIFSKFNPIVITPIKGRELMQYKPFSIVLNTSKINQPKWGVTKLSERDTFGRRKRVKKMVEDGRTIAFMAKELRVSTKTISVDKKYI